MQIQKNRFGYFCSFKGEDEKEFLVGFGGRELKFNIDQEVCELKPERDFQNMIESFELFPKGHWDFSKIKFSRLKQTHGDRLELSSDKKLVQAPAEADAHYAKESNLAVAVASADCIPVMIANTVSGSVVAIHAGWRGVSNQITIKAIQALSSKYSDFRARHLKVFIGPHIQFNNFEVDKDVRDLILASAGSGRLVNWSREGRQSEGVQKYHVDLNAIIVHQLAMAKIPSENIFCITEDTKTNEDWHSYRRNNKEAGRNWSFVVSK